LVVVSHTYVEATNRGKLKALARGGPVTAVVPRRWRETALRRDWTTASGTDEGVAIAAVRWWGARRPSWGGVRVPRTLLAGAGTVLQIEEEPWTPSAWAAVRAGHDGPTVLFTWENLKRSFPPPWSRMRRAVFARLDGLIAGNREAESLARELGYRGPAIVLPQLGIDLPAESPRESSTELRVVFAGRLVPEKGVDLLLGALARVAAPWRLTVVGDGPERARLEHLAAEPSLGARVRFAGAQPHAAVARFLAAADVLVLPSRASASWREQFGHVLVEAMAEGTAVIGSTCGAIPEVVGEAGLVFPEDDAGALAAHLATLAGEPARARALGDAGRRRVAEHYTHEAIAARTRAFHEAVIRGSA
jgi:glycosyltransferase involved in cell wall biosynthesis